MIKNVCFDFGGVIVDYDAKHYLDYFNFDKNKAEYLNDIVFKSEDFTKLSLGKISQKDFYKNLIKNYPKDAFDIDKILDVKLLPELMPVKTKTIEFIQNLKKHGYSVYIISDIIPDTLTYLKTTILKNLIIDGAVFSCEVGEIKRNKKIFEIFLNKYNLQSNECLFIDDDQFKLDSAKLVGLNCYLFKNNKTDYKNIESIINLK